MKIVIVGPGAMGSLFAGLLSRSKTDKPDICLLDKKKDRAERLRKNGIRLEGLTILKTGPLQVSCDPKDFKDADLWMCCVKSYDTREVARAIEPFVSKEATVVSIQNGLGNIELLAETFGANRVVAGVTSMAATLTDEGACRHTGEGETLFGRLDGGLTVALKDLRELFLKARIPAKISRDVTSLVWSKLIVNAGINALSAVTRLRNGSLMAHEGSRRLMKEAVQEAFRVAKRKRIKLSFDDPLAKASSVCEATAENVSSMLADILARKRTEIDFLNGAIVRQADSLGLKAPVNALLVDIVKTLESSYQDQVREA